MSNVSNTADVAECPFCGREVDADLVVYGGKCPHCFGDIPGEEAPTDPGEAKKKAETKAISAKVQRSQRMPLFVVSGLLLIPIAIALYLLLKPVPRMEALNLDLPEYDIAELAPAVVVAPEIPATVQDNGKPGKNSKNPGTDIAKVGGGTNVGNPEKTPEVVGTQGGTSSPDGTLRPRNPVATAGGTDATLTGGISTSSGGGVISDAPKIGIQRRAITGVTLTDDSQIIEMVRAVVGSELPKLRFQCYERQLKRDETLAGSWILNFTVKQNGQLNGVSAVSKDGTPNAEFEACLVEKVSTWAFQPIKAELPVAKTATFRAN